jgi:hypothetical protein
MTEPGKTHADARTHSAVHLEEPVLTYLQRLVDERMTLTEMATRAADKAATEDRDLGDTEKQSLAEWETRCKEIDSQLTQYNAQAESARAFADLTSRLETSRERPASNGLEGRRPAAIETTTWGQQFTDSDQFRSYPGRGQSGAVELTDYLPHQQRAAIMTTDLAIPNYVLPPRVQDITIPPLLSVVDVVGVNAGVVEWVEIAGDPVAAVVAEGAVKPEAVLTFTPQSAPLDTIAHYSQITRQALEDASYIRSVIEGKLRRGITLKIAESINNALVGAAIPPASVPLGGSLLEAIRVGIGVVQSNGYNPNAVLLNPADWADLDMSVMGGTLGGPTVGSTFWGLTPIASRLQPVGTATVGDFKAGVVWFDRNVSSVFISDSHADLFIKNTLVILAETRGKAAVPEPLALCEVAVSPTAGTASASKK